MGPGLATATTTWAIVLAVVFIGGVLKGMAGFGYAVASTALLATVLDPATAVVLMILPTLAANVSLLGELDADEARRCAARFWPYVGAALVGTLIGMGLLGLVPRQHLALGLGLLTFGYVLTKQEYVTLPGEAAAARYCFRSGTGAKAALGLVSGMVFGATNVAVQVVAYLDYLELDRSTFVGVLAMILVGISTVRVGAAWFLGLYATGSLLVLSAVAAVPGLAGVKSGGLLREHVPGSYQTAGTLLLLAVIAARLTSTGLAGM